MFKKKKKDINFDKWLSENLKQDPKFAKGFLDETIENFDKDGNIEILLSSLSQVAKAKGWTWLKKETGISRRALYNALSTKGNPRIKTFLNILNSLGYSMKIARVN